MSTVMVVCRGKPEDNMLQRVIESANYVLAICGMVFLRHESGCLLWLGLDIKQRSQRNAVWDDDEEKAVVEEKEENEEEVIFNC